MKYKLFLVVLLVVYVFTGCVRNIEPEYVHTTIDIQFSDDVSPCRATLTPEEVGEETVWKIDGETVDGALVNESGVLELILEPNTEIHVNYETVLENTVYFSDNLLEAPPVANKLILYSMNLSAENFNEQPVSLNAQYDYDFNYRFSYDDASVNHPNTIVFTNELSNRQYELQVDWIYELAM